MNRQPLIIIFLLSELGICLFIHFSVSSSQIISSRRELLGSLTFNKDSTTAAGAWSAGFSSGVDSRWFLTSSVSCGFVDGKFGGFFHVEEWEIKS